MDSAKTSCSSQENFPQLLHIFLLAQDKGLLDEVVFLSKSSSDDRMWWSEAFVYSFLSPKYVKFHTLFNWVFSDYEGRFSIQYRKVCFKESKWYSLNYYKHGFLKLLFHFLNLKISKLLWSPCKTKQTKIRLSARILICIVYFSFTVWNNHWIIGES